MDDDEDMYSSDGGGSQYEEDDMPSTPIKPQPWRNQQDIAEDDDGMSGKIQGTPLALRERQEAAANWDNPFYKFSITLLKQFIEYNLRGQPTQVTEDDVKKLAHDIMVRLYDQEERNIDKILIELTKHILVLRYAREAGFNSFLKALRDKNFYLNTEVTSGMVGQAVNGVLYERFGIDLFQRANRYITFQYQRRTRTPNMVPLSYPADDQIFPQYENRDRTPEGRMPWDREISQDTGQRMGMALGGGGADLERAESEKRKRQQEIQDQSLRDKEKLARMMGQIKPKDPKRGLFDVDKSKASKIQRTMNQEKAARDKKLFQGAIDKAAVKRDKQDEEYKLKFFAGQKIKVYRPDNKKWYSASIVEVEADGLVVKYDENDSEAVIEWRKILNEKYNLIRIVSEEKKETKEFSSTKEAMRKGGGFSPTNCSGGTCDTCLMVIEKKPFQSFKKKGKGKNQEFIYLMFCSVGCMEKKKF
jgi:hypothetical protein